MNKEFYKSKVDIENWLNQYNIINYSLISDEKYGFVIDVIGQVDLSKKNLDWIPVKFNKISGTLLCSDNELTSLEFCPEKVGGNFWCSNNSLETLKFCPEYVGKGFSCSNNKLTSLEFCPKSACDYFSCSGNKLRTLEFCPKEIAGIFVCSGNKLETLEFGPKIVGGDFYCNENKLTSLEFCPEHIGGDFIFSSNKICDLLHFPSFVKNKVKAEMNLLKNFNKEDKFNVFYEEHKRQIAEVLRNKLEKINLGFKNNNGIKI